MYAFKQKSLLTSCFVLCSMVFFQGIGLAQESAIEALKRQLAEMQTQMQKMAERIEQLEREKGAAVAKSSQVELPQSKSDPQTVPQPGTAKGISSAFNPAMSVNALFLGGRSSSPRTTNRLTGLDFHNGFNFQEAEFEFTADVDPYWRANFILGIDRRGETELEEGYVTSEELPYDLLPRNTSLKLGKFFAGFGKHNLLHAHQFPFVDQPLVSRSVFGEEGLREPGLSVAYLLPSPWFSELTFQGLAGENEGLFRFQEEPERDAKRRGAYLGHWKNFFDLSDTATLEVGNSYVAGRNSDSRHRLSQAVGLDLTIKWRPLQMATERGLIWQSEYLYFTRDRGREAFTRGGGLYSSLQYQFARRWWIQGRYDLLGTPKFDDGRKHRWSTLLAFVPSEFSAVRLQHSYTSQERGSPVNQILLQLNFTIGSHKAHQY
ncbi:MAG: hypothetical protein HY694_15610 [Deltaproteobacteria bacterium]|nr:hypothetical protein [Deltaproteobacteria bacterium]